MMQSNPKNLTRYTHSAGLGGKFPARNLLNIVTVALRIHFATRVTHGTRSTDS
jgi:hypothetical protein